MAEVSESNRTGTHLSLAPFSRLTTDGSNKNCGGLTIPFFSQLRTKDKALIIPPSAALSSPLLGSCLPCAISAQTVG